MEKHIEKIIRRYNALSLCIVAALSAVIISVMRGLCDLAVEAALVVSVVYSLTFNYIYGYCWKKIIVDSSDTVAKYYLAAMTIRLLSAALILTAYCMIVKERVPIIHFVVVFSIFYLMMIIYDTAFFAIVERKNLIKKKQ